MFEFLKRFLDYFISKRVLSGDITNSAIIPTNINKEVKIYQKQKNLT